MVACDLPGTFYSICSGEGDRSCSAVVALVSYWSYCTQGLQSMVGDSHGGVSGKYLFWGGRRGEWGCRSVSLRVFYKGEVTLGIYTEGVGTVHWVRYTDAGSVFEIDEETGEFLGGSWVRFLKRCINSSNSWESNSNDCRRRLFLELNREDNDSIPRITTSPRAILIKYLEDFGFAL